jgi:cobalt-precorrin 5A hydrolase
MDLVEAMIVAGIGCRRGAPAADIEAAIAAALSRAGFPPTALGIIATAAMKDGENGIKNTAAKLGLSLILVQQSELEAANSRTLTRSERVAALTGVSSIAEAAALVAAGPAARLLGPRVAVRAATCALASSGDEP